MRTLAERFGFKPTRFLPNGCGAGITAKLVPDEVAGANFDHCCDQHDLAYHIGKGGWHGIFWAKPMVDFMLMRCMDQQFNIRTVRLMADDRYLKGFATLVAGVVIPPLYFVALTLLGWTPLTWPWKERPMPSHEQLAALAHNLND